MMEFSEKLQELRKQKGMTQEELADRLNISRHTVIGIESKNRVMPWTTFLAIVFLFERFEETKLLLHVLKIYPVEYEDELHSNFEVV